MCGPSTPSTTPRVGARVDFFPAPGRTLPLGNLLFLNPSSPTSRHATHVRFCQSTPTTCLDSSVLVSIHMTGDLTKPLADSGLMREFTLCGGGSGGEDGVDMALGGKALELGVGDEGIIGRRVSMRLGGEVVADGIVGFNFS
ncbi:hypothetical protein C8A05DRAFT_29762 [Staphylotrichum tortipilum]|uniref:Uncharacterized protein n=1 Tax=Staphylotrichum tortipilum TaxID=2831512 RepID=A0AAN6MVG8_9PEZI|nr:hypothetical protein C8A05DRAFT_29762 [Staphylotrichum longicolle]